MTSTCIICFDTLEPTNKDDLTPDELQEEYNRKRSIFQSFCTQFDIPLHDPTQTSQKWDFEVEPLPFCVFCQKTLKNLNILHEQLETVQKSIAFLKNSIKTTIVERGRGQTVVNEGFEDARLHMIRNIILEPRNSSSFVPPQQMSVQPLANEGNSNFHELQPSIFNEHCYDGQPVHPFPLQQQHHYNNNNYDHNNHTNGLNIQNSNNVQVSESELSSSPEEDDDLDTASTYTSAWQMRHNNTSYNNSIVLDDLTDDEWPTRKEAVRVIKLPEVDLWSYSGYKFTGSKEKGFKCIRCRHPTCYKVRADMIRHIRVRHLKNLKTHFCCYCGMKFFRPTRLRRHLKSVHNVDSDEGRVTYRSSMGTQMSDYSSANESFHSSRASVVHNSAGGEQQQQQNGSLWRKYFCELCCLKFKNFQELQLHRKQVHPLPPPGRIRPHPRPHSSNFERDHLSHHHPSSSSAYKTIRHLPSDPVQKFYRPSHQSDGHSSVGTQVSQFSPSSEAQTPHGPMVHDHGTGFDGDQQYHQQFQHQHQFSPSENVCHDSPHSFNTAGHPLILNCQFCHCMFTLKEHLEEHIEKFHSSSPMTTTTLVSSSNNNSDDNKNVNNNYNINSESTSLIPRSNSISTIPNGSINIRNLETFACKICGMEFEKAVRLRRHMRKMHQSIREVVGSTSLYSPVSDTQESESGRDLFPDKFTSDQTTNHHHQQYQVQYPSPPSEKPKTSSSSMFECHLCDSNFKFKENLIKHFNRFHPQFNCEEYIDNNNGSLLAKENNISMDTTTTTTTTTTTIKQDDECTSRHLDCPHCTEKFGHDVILSRHVVQVHKQHSNNNSAEESPSPPPELFELYICKKCGKTYATGKSLRNHEVATHKFEAGSGGGGGGSAGQKKSKKSNAEKEEETEESVDK